MIFKTLRLIQTQSVRNLTAFSKHRQFCGCLKPLSSQSLALNSNERRAKYGLSFSTSRIPQQKPDSDEPVKFSGSQADWKAANTFRAPESGAPRYQYVIVQISVAVFMLYFFVLREENDLDENLSDLYYAIDPYKEIEKLELQLAKEIKQGQDTSYTAAKLSKMYSRMGQSDLQVLEDTLKRIEMSVQAQK